MKLLLGVGPEEEKVVVTLHTDMDLLMDPIMVEEVEAMNIMEATEIMEGVMVIPGLVTTMVMELDSIRPHIPFLLILALIITAMIVAIRKL